MKYEFYFSRILKSLYSYNKWNDLTEIQASLSTYLEDAEIDNECAAHSEYEIKVMDYMARMTQYLSVNKHVESSNASGSSTGSSGNVQVKLPKIELPTFDGDILCWQSYYQSVKVSIVDNSTLADVQKLEYIMRSLRVRLQSHLKDFQLWLKLMSLFYQPSRKDLDIPY